MSGSSPLTRGKLEQGVHDFVGVGLIPAHAGKTRSRSCSFYPGRAHPRSRGENQLACLVRGRRDGSSPLTRGKHRKRARLTPRLGLIPAHAGKTSARTRYVRRRWAHPRSRGENRSWTRSAPKTRGSSPLTRGKRRARGPRRRHTGLIPAHAGKTRPIRAMKPKSRAHPRSRGENTASRASPVTPLGSSPLTRGKPRWRHRPPLDWGLIPAHAGKTLKWGCLAVAVLGSSPLTRGKPC